MPIEFVDGNRLTLLHSGSEFFPALIEAIDGAAEEINLETYIFIDDTSGRAVTSALQRAAQRGVIVRLLVDGFGSSGFSEQLQPELTQAGIQAMTYRRDIARFSFRRHRLRRLHRKLASIDGRIAFVGGINIVDDRNRPQSMTPRFDYAVRVEGELVASIRFTMLRLWEIVVWASFRRRYRLRHHDRKAMPPLAAKPIGQERAALVVRDNIRHRHAIEDAYLAAINNAGEEVIIANAYFLPGIRFRRSILEAAARGVKIRILLQGRIEYRLQHYATQALYGALLNAGVRIYEYQPGFLHAKVATVDGEWSTVGSSNIDPFSLLLAKEANIVVLNRGFTMQLRQSLMRAMSEDARELKAHEWEQLSWHSRLLRWVSYQLVRLAIGIAGYGGRH